MDHVLLKDNKLNGWEYGMLRSFEKAILKETRGTSVEIPEYILSKDIIKHFGQGMNRGKYRQFFPKQSFELKADVVWYILMGPENYRLDLYKNWDKNCKFKILYLFDTLPSQYPLIKRVVEGGKWDLLITSFNDSVQDLERITGQKWNCVEQGADDFLFKPVPIEDRVIHFSSYGRRYPILHETLKEFCDTKGLYYDYTTHDARHPVVDATELYKQYSWHINHSLFTLSWPVEFTNPQRAGHLRPITCRWFEAAAAGTIILGKKPDNSEFDALLDENLVLNIDPNKNRIELFTELEKIWDRRTELLAKATIIANSSGEAWAWSERAKRIINWINK